jgi:TRAP-type C4-dicarboxylate transport system permease small subunit
LSDSESLIIGALAVLLLFWMQPNIKNAIARSKKAQSDWLSLLLPIGVVVIFVVFLIATV